jgi:hypothetical protein
MPSNGGGVGDLTFVYYKQWFTHVPAYTFITTDSATGVAAPTFYFDEKSLMQWFGRKSPIHQDRLLRTWRGAACERAILTKKGRDGKRTLISCNALSAWLSGLRRRIMTIAAAELLAPLNNDQWLVRICRVSSTHSYSPWQVYTIVTTAEFAVDMTREQQVQELKRLRSTAPIQDETERDEAACDQLFLWRLSCVDVDTRANTNTPPGLTAGGKRRRITPELLA